MMVKTVLDLTDRMLAGQLQPMDLVAARGTLRPGGGHMLSEKTYTAMEAQRKLLEEHPINDKGLTTALASARAAIPDVLKASDFTNDFMSKYLALPAKERPSALQFSNPNSLISQTMELHLHPPSTGPSVMDRITDPSVMDRIFGSRTAITPGAATWKNRVAASAATVPPDMTPAQAIIHYGYNVRVRLPDGTYARTPARPPNAPTSR